MGGAMKPFAWSFSKLKNFETCPFRHDQIDLKKLFKDDSEQLRWGNMVHDSMAAACSKGAMLPVEMAQYQKWVDRVRAGSGALLVEQQYAINAQFERRGWFDKDVWYRGIGDVVRVDTDLALVLDWKTGKVKVDSVQLMLMAQCIFSYYPQVQLVRSEFVWLQEDCSTPEMYTRQNLAREWPALLARVQAMEHAYNTQTYLPRPSRLCRRHCPVQSCQYHGQAHGG